MRSNQQVTLTKITLVTAFLFSLFGVSPKASAFWGSADYSKTSCKDLRGEIVELSQSQTGQVQIIKIYEPTQVSRSSSKVQCKGIAALNNGAEVRIKYSAFKDREGDWMVQFSE